MTPRDHSHEHLDYCAKKNVLPMRKSVPMATCPTCQAWINGFQAAVGAINMVADDGDDDE